ncbi:MAG: FeoA family protein [Spongiibacteraceae bacterium]
MFQPLNLSDLPIGVDADVITVRLPTDPNTVSVEDRDILLRLIEIGFVPGERVRVIAVGHPGREPIAVRIGGTTFGLRRFEADLVQVQALSATQHLAATEVAS